MLFRSQAVDRTRARRWGHDPKPRPRLRQRTAARMRNAAHWGLGGKLALVGAPFFLLGVCLIALTLWMSWQLDGGAAAVNEAGRLRMQTWRMASVAAQNEPAQLARHSSEMQGGLELLREGDPERPLLVPWDARVRGQFTQVESGWVEYRQLLMQPAQDPAWLNAEAGKFSASIDALVAAIESHLSVWTAMLHLVQTGMLALAVLGAAVLLFAGYVLVLEPMAELKQAIGRMQQGNLGARIDVTPNDEFGRVAAGFNQMAEHLQSMYQGLEGRVAAKTAELEQKKHRLESLYRVTSLASTATTQEELGKGFAASLREVAHADAVALRWSDPTQQRFMLLAAQGLPEAMLDAEQCVHVGHCHCAEPDRADLRVIPIRSENSAPMKHCREAGFATVISVPIRQHGRPVGELELFFHAEIDPSPAERSLYEALAHHLAAAMENLRLGERDRESAVSQERTLMAQELHDSIAQSLAFLRIQVQLMRDAIKEGQPEQVANVLSEIDAGVRESYADVRELLLNFRTRSETEDIEPALSATLCKFEHQSGLRSSLKVEGHGLPLGPETQIQVLHILQEALSNVRKHARASHVWLEVLQHPHWRFEVRDNGIGFAGNCSQAGESHVGLRIMAERAARIDAQLEVRSVPGAGTSIVLSLPAPQPGQVLSAAPNHPATATLH